MLPNSKLRNIDEFEEIYFARQRIMWGIDLSLLKDGVYDGNIKAPIDIKEFKGFKEELGLGINEVSGYLDFYACKSLTSVGVLPQEIGGDLFFSYCESLTIVGVLPLNVGRVLSFYRCTSLTSVGVFPEKIGSYLDFFYCESLTSVGVLPRTIGSYLDFSRCESLTSIEQFPKVVNGGIYTYSTTFFENMTVKQIREKYGIE